MLAGEYAVLGGGRCIAATVDRCLKVRVSAGQGRIRSDLWPGEEILWRDIAPSLKEEEALFQVLACLDGQFPIEALDIEVKSDLDPRHGLGSSTAVRLATLAAIEAFHGQAEEPLVQARRVWQWQLAQQSFASGYDALVQARGGLMLWSPDYTDWPGPLAAFPASALQPWIQIWVGGQGAPTQALGSSVRSWLSAQRLEIPLGESSDALVEAFHSLITEGSLEALSKVCRATAVHRQLLSAAPAYPRHLLAALEGLAGFDQQWTFKTTGAGGEDAVLLIGQAADLAAPAARLRALAWYPLQAHFSDQGLTVAGEDRT